ncbi:hypothetical protein [Spiroplasma monobiae]|uniref:Lipoprotein n=1 Tax=Spiroplasma monobiae MQ-1 TaxID=1336748 RepID=A0A2K9LUR6_SPISQ|nr:hypothetical protein [Spiroplasma monobiae]AUM62789.1 hypothetical protein SMONO_v1c05400 [Spiroplasma monobiae MQ-1]
MKKICSILGSLTLTVVASTTVVACNGGLDTSLNYTDQEKILSIYNLTEDQLVKSGVKVNSLMSNEDIDKVLESLGLSEAIQNNPMGGMIKKSLGVYIMANQFLSEISSKVPGYGWIANKLTWQSQWTIKDLVSGNTSAGLFNNVSGWMKNKNDWSLSVTFLDEDLLGWNGVREPVYARININRKLVADNSGIVVLDESHPEGVHKQGSDEINVVDPVINDQQDTKGVIYQGYSTSSKLFELNRMQTGKTAKVPSGIFNFSPSAADFINNKIINLDFGNMILQNSKEKIEQALNEYILANPFYISEGMDAKQIDNIIKNQIYVVMICEAIDRHNLKDKEGRPLFDETEKADADAIVTGMMGSLTNAVNNLKSKEWTNKTLLDEFSSMINTIRNNGNEFGSINKTQFANKFQEVIEDSRNKFDVNSNQFAFYSGQLNAILYKNNGRSSMTLTNQSSYFDFGYDSSYKFEIYYWSGSTPITGKEEQWYKPDENRSQEEYISDKGFRNVFLGQRLSPQNGSYNALIQYINQLPEKRLDLDIFGLQNHSLPASVSNLETIMLEKLNEAISLDGEQEISGVDHDSWRIYHVIALFNKYATEKLIEIFGYDSSNNLEIHNKKVSLDYSESTSSNVDYSKADDDIAFAQLLQEGQINMTTRNMDKLRTDIYDRGLKKLWDKEDQSQRMYVGKVNIYGKRLDSDEDLNNIGQWWNDSSRFMGTFPYGLAISDEWKPLIEEYWKKHVSDNKNNPDYNANIW